MSFLVFSGTIDLPVAAVDRTNVFKQLVDCLNERFDKVAQTADTVDAQAGSLHALIMRGPRTHPMLAFSHVHFELSGTNPLRLRYKLDARWHFVLASLLALVSGLFASLANGWQTGAAIGIVLSGGVLLLNNLFARIRVGSWLRGFTETTTG